ncbi:MAG TPA: ATP-binding protein [Bacteroidota bacterium]|nr:ATP-binding protein [Bacteroidota bacterium]
MKSLRLKIGTGFTIIVLIGLATSFFALLKFVQLRNEVAPIIRTTYQSALGAENLIRSLDDQEHALLSAVIDEPEMYRAYFNDSRDIFIDWLVRMKNSAPTPTQNALVDSIITTDSLYNRAAETLFTYLINKNNIRLGSQYQKYVVRPIAEKLRNQCSQLLEANQTAMKQAEHRIERTTHEAIVSVIIAALLSIVLSITTAVRFTRSVIQPAEKLTNIVRRISQGNLNQKIDIVTDDEIGVLSIEFNKMTERLRQYEEININKLLAEKKKTETIVSSISEPVIVTDVNGTFVLVNQAAASLFSIPQDWEGKKPQDVFTDEKILQVLEGNNSETDVHGNRDVLMEFEKDGETIYYRPHQTRIMDVNGEIEFVVTIFHDVTRFKTLERMKSEFIATVSHELRTPLTSLAMGIDILLKEIAGAVTPQQRELLNAAKDDAERLRKLVKDLLDLSKLESAKYELQKELTNFAHITDTAVKALRFQFQEKSIDLQVNVPPSLPFLYVDGEKITWVLTNLLNNALRYTDPGGRVTISAEVKNNLLVVSVADTGKGIPEEYQEIIFEKFVQIKPATETTPGSVGLGLAIAREIIENHKGQIWVSSKVGVGSTFYFTIPLNG